MRDLISVLLPVQNGGDLLSQALDSLITQTYPTWEALVFNDGSTDETGQALEAYAQRDARVKPLGSTQGVGIVAALNRCLELASGQWFARLDHDDIMLPQRLERQLAYARSLPAPALIGSQIALKSLGAPLRPGQLAYRQWQNELLTPAEHATQLYREAPIAHPSLFGALSLLRDLGGYRQEIWAEDYDLFFRAYLAGIELRKMDQVLTEKRIHPQQLTWRDPRCHRPAFFAAKAHFFTLDPRFQHKKRIYLAGIGPSGKQAAKALQRVGVPLEGFLDDREFPSNKTIAGLPLWRLNPAWAKQWDESALILLTLSEPQTRKQATEVLASHGLRLGLEVIPWS